MQNLKAFICKEAAACVRCGLCLPHCPTYQTSQHEGESPRGRIMLLEGIALGELNCTSQAKNYLEHCLTCGICEEVCPIPVNYGKLYAAGQQLIAQKTRSRK